MASILRTQSSPIIYHAFLTHTWQQDELGRNNHERVKKVHHKLKRMGINSWFDEERMHGDVQSQMCKGIDESAVIVTFVTDKYIKKVDSGDKADNCFKEFSCKLLMLNNVNCVILNLSNRNFISSSHTLCFFYTFNRCVSS